MAENRRFHWFDDFAPMLYGIRSAIATRQECDYKSEIVRIKSDISLSNVPASFYERKEPMINAIIKFFRTSIIDAEHVLDSFKLKDGICD